MRKISANYIFPLNGPPIKNGVIVLNDKDIIVEIYENSDLKESEKLEFYNGVIVPGFVNAHSHLELAAFKNKLPEKSKFPAFLENIVKEKRRIEEKELYKDANLADKYMYSRGISAVADISNSILTGEIKSKSRIDYTSFVELYSTKNISDDEVLEKGKKIKDEFRNKYNLKANLSPHSFYSLSNSLFKRICEKSDMISVHNQESNKENEFSISGKGEIASFISRTNPKIKNEKITAKTSLQSMMDYLPGKSLLVHNLYTSEKDIKIAIESGKIFYWVLCPNSNMFIENKLPDIELLNKYNLKIALGTDSLASNKKLCILEEIKTILNNLPAISFEKALKWATINGAKALNVEKKLGSLEKGKSPGLVLIHNFDFKNFKPGKNSFAERIV